MKQIPYNNSTVLDTVLATIRGDPLIHKQLAGYSIAPARPLRWRASACETSKHPQTHTLIPLISLHGQTTFLWRLVRPLPKTSGLQTGILMRYVFPCLSNHTGVWTRSLLFYKGDASFARQTVTMDSGHLKQTVETWFV